MFNKLLKLIQLSIYSPEASIKKVKHKIQKLVRHNKKTIPLFNEDEWDKSKMIAICVGFNQIKLQNLENHLVDYQIINMPKKATDKELIVSLKTITVEYKVYIWNYTESLKIKKYFSANSIPIIRVGNGLFRSSKLPLLQYSLIFDSKDLYYKDTSSDLEDLLETYDFALNNTYKPKSMAFIQILIDYDIDLYRDDATELENFRYESKKKERILIAGEKTNLSGNYELILLAKKENPNAEIIYKPYYNNLNQENHSEINKINSIADLILRPIKVNDMLETIDCVYVNTSLLGLEGMIRNIPVKCIGKPFYTQHDSTIEQFIYVFFFLYSAYRIPNRSKEPYTPLDILPLLSTKYLLEFIDSQKLLGDYTKIFHPMSSTSNQIEYILLLMSDKKINLQYFDYFFSFIVEKGSEKNIVNILEYCFQKNLQDTEVPLDKIIESSKKMLSSSGAELFANRIIQNIDNIPKLEEIANSLFYFNRNIAFLLFEYIIKTEPTSKRIELLAKRYLSVNLFSECDRICMLIDDDIKLKYIMINSYLKQEEYSKAEQICLKILADDPSNKKTIHLYGKIMFFKLEYAKTIRLFSELKEYNPLNGVYYEWIASAHFNKMQFHTATKVAKKGLKTQSNLYQLNVLLGNIYFNQLKYRQALRHFVKASKLRPYSLNPYIQIRKVSERLNIDFDNDYEKKIIDLLDGYSKFMLLGQLSFEDEEFTEAIKYFQAAYSKTNNKLALFWMAKTYSYKRDFYHSELFYKKIFDDGNSNPELLFYADMLRNLNAQARHLDALTFKEKYSSLFKLPALRRPADLWNRKILFSTHNYSQAYSWYINTKVGQSIIATSKINFTTKLSNDMANKDMLVLGIWGPGDDLIFGSSYTYLFQKYPNAIVTCDKRMQSLFQRSFPLNTFVGVSRNLKGFKKLTDINHFNKLPNLQLSLLMDNNVWNEAQKVDAVTLNAYIFSDFIQKTAKEYISKNYLIPKKELIDYWKIELAKLGSAVKIGISWRSSHVNVTRNQYYTSLDSWGRILKNKDAIFINLQYDDCQKEIEALFNHHNVKLHVLNIDLFNDFENMAALLVALDVAISPFTTMAELSGAVGANAYITIPSSDDTSWRINEVDQSDILYPNMKHIVGTCDNPKESLLNNIETIIIEECKMYNKKQSLIDYTV